MPAWIASGLPSKGFLLWVWADGTAHAITHETTTAANNRHVMAAILLACGTEVPPLAASAEASAGQAIFASACRRAWPGRRRLRQIPSTFQSGSDADGSKA